MTTTPEEVSPEEISPEVQAVNEAFARLKVLEDIYREHFGPIPAPAERDTR